VRKAGDRRFELTGDGLRLALSGVWQQRDEAIAGEPAEEVVAAQVQQ